MGEAKVGHPLPPLLADVPLRRRDFQGVVEEVGGGVPGHHNVRRYLGHGVQGPQTAAVGAVAPGGVVFAVALNPGCKNTQNEAQQEQAVRRQIQHPVQHKSRGQLPPVVGRPEGQGDQIDQQQHPKMANPAVHRQGVHRGQGEKHKAVQEKVPAAKIRHGHPGVKAEVQRHHVHGNGRFKIALLAVQEADQRKEQACRRREGHLAPDISVAARSSHTGQHNSDHRRSDHAQRHQPGQRVFPADVESDSFVHGAIIPIPLWEFNKKQRILRLPRRPI